MDGPGCVKRIWMTNVPAKEWLFYFDGETEPRLRLAQEKNDPHPWRDLLPSRRGKDITDPAFNADLRGRCAQLLADAAALLEATLAHGDG